MDWDVAIVKGLVYYGESQGYVIHSWAPLSTQILAEQSDK